MTAGHAVTSDRRWPGHARCESWTRSAPHHRPTVAQSSVWAPLPATESAPGVAAHSQAVIAASTSSESRVQTDAGRRETHAAWHARPFLLDGWRFGRPVADPGQPGSECSRGMLTRSGPVG